jgi:hypothetical protein
LLGLATSMFYIISNIKEGCWSNKFVWNVCDYY